MVDKFISFKKNTSLNRSNFTILIKSPEFLFNIVIASIVDIQPERSFKKWERYYLVPISTLFATPPPAPGILKVRSI